MIPVYKLIGNEKHIYHEKLERVVSKQALVTDVNYTKDALHDLLDSLGALGGSWHELCGWGFSEERAKEIIGYCQ